MVKENTIVPKPGPISHPKGHVSNPVENVSVPWNSSVIPSSLLPAKEKSAWKERREHAGVTADNQ
jgi:hypothetical protein